MQTIISGIIDIKDLANEISAFLNEHYGFQPDFTIRAIEGYTSALKSDLTTYVEYPYVDKIFRNSYYSYFSTKLRTYDRDCMRISLFSKEITPDHFREEHLYEELQGSFLGFLTIRPALPKIIARAIISPKALKSMNFSCSLVEMDALINGRKLSVLAFPHASQDTETVTCAETTICVIMEYFGKKYAEYKPVLPSKIISVLSPFSYERQIPSHGLTAEQISFALKSFDFGVRIYAKRSHKSDLKRIFNYYIESGIPFVAVLENSQIGHGVIVIGRENWGHTTVPPGATYETITSDNNRNIQIFDTADIQQKYIAIDDNYPPYISTDFEYPTAYYTDPKFQGCIIHSIIVPLYHKIYLEALQARKLVFSILKSDISSGISGKVILRLLLMSSRLFKHAIAANLSIDKKVRDLILFTVMAKFVWVAELSNPSLFPEKKAFGLILLDATEANENSSDAMLFTVYANNFIIFNEKRVLELNTVSFCEYDTNFNNLKGAF